MKKLLLGLACLVSITLNAFTTGFTPIEQKDISNFNLGSDKRELSAKDGLSTHWAKGFKGGKKGKKMGPGSKRRDPNQANQGNNKGKEHKTNQTENNRQKHEPAEARRNKEQGKANDKNNQRHGKQKK